MGKLIQKPTSVIDKSDSALPLIKSENCNTDIVDNFRKALDQIIDRALKAQDELYQSYAEIRTDG